MWQELMPALRMTMVMTILTGLLYPALVTGIAQTVFPRQANGNLIERGGRVIGSELIGQQFTRPEYFHPRPSAAGAGYDPLSSGGSNLGPTSAKLAERVKAAIADYRTANPEYTGPIPPDAVLASASGLDPHITPANAQTQATRVARARAVELSSIQEILREFAEPRDLRVLGEPRINVLKLNLALDERLLARR